MKIHYDLLFVTSTRNFNVLSVKKNFRPLSYISTQNTVPKRNIIHCTSHHAPRYFDDNDNPSFPTIFSGSRIASPTRLRLSGGAIAASVNRKRAVSWSPYSAESLDLAAVIRASPGSLAVRAPSAGSTGSYGHLSAGKNTLSEVRTYIHFALFSIQTCCPSRASEGNF